MHYRGITAVAPNCQPSYKSAMKRDVYCYRDYWFLAGLKAAFWPFWSVCVCGSLLVECLNCWPNHLPDFLWPIAPPPYHHSLWQPLRTFRASEHSHFPLSTQVDYEDSFVFCLLNLLVAQHSIMMAIIASFFQQFIWNLLLPSSPPSVPSHSFSPKPRPFDGHFQPLSHAPCHQAISVALSC